MECKNNDIKTHACRTSSGLLLHVHVRLVKLSEALLVITTTKQHYILSGGTRGISVVPHESPFEVMNPEQQTKN